jgi:hypothetical protein
MLKSSSNDDDSSNKKLERCMMREYTNQHHAGLQVETNMYVPIRGHALQAITKTIGSVEGARRTRRTRPVIFITYTSGDPRVSLKVAHPFRDTSLTSKNS